MGDFNGIFSFEKRGGRLWDEKQMVAFKHTLEDCRLHDLGFSGQWFTWERGQLVDNNIHERLDRGVANSDWWIQFPNYSMKCNTQNS